MTHLDNEDVSSRNDRTFDDLNDLRARVLSAWHERAIHAVDAPAEGGRPLLAGRIAALYDDISRAVSLSGAGSLTVHKRFDWETSVEQTVSLSPTLVNDLISEFQIFRGIIFSQLATQHIKLSKRQNELIGNRIELATRQAIFDLFHASRETDVDLIAHFTHDVRNPLNVACALAQLISRQCADQNAVMLASRIAEKIRETDVVLRSLNKGSFHCADQANRPSVNTCKPDG